jgi:hypothetical protein
VSEHLDHNIVEGNMNNLKLATITGLFIGAYMCTANWNSPYIVVPAKAEANDVQELVQTTTCALECNACQSHCSGSSSSIHSCKTSCVSNMSGCCIAAGAKPNIGSSVCICAS